MKKYSLLLIALFATVAIGAINIDVDTLRSPDQTKIWSLPSATDTLMGRAETETVTGTKTFSSQLISTVTTGTAPLSVSSTTLVPNLYVARSVLSDTVSTNANLTGPITSVGNATSIASQTGTGTKFVMDTSPTLITPEIGVATGSSLTLTDKLVSAYQTPTNLLINGDVELSSISAFTCTVGTCTRTTTSGEFSQGIAALKVSISAQAMNVSQTVTPPTGIQKQGFARVIYKVPSTLETFQVCTLVDGSEQTCVPTASLVLDNTFRSIEIPLVFGSTSAGIKFKTSSDTGDAFFDGMIVSQGLGIQNIQLDNVYSAKVGGSGTVSDENKDWINGSCTNANPRVCTLSTGIFTLAPSCTVSGTIANRIAVVSASSSTSVSITTTLDDGSLSSADAYIICQKQGADYLASSASVYSQNSNKLAYATVFSAQISSTGGVSTENLDWISSCTNANPSVCTLNSGVSTVAMNCVATPVTSSDRAATIDVNAGDFSVWTKDSTGAPTATAVKVVCQRQGVDYDRAVNPNITGSFAGVPAVPGYEGKVDTFSVSYGATATTVCSTPSATCAYNDNIGSSASVSKTGATGRYTLSAGKTYLKLKCNLTSFGASQATMAYSTGSGLSCSNCSTLIFGTVRTTTEGYTDSYGNLDCKGTY